MSVFDGLVQIDSNGNIVVNSWIEWDHTYIYSVNPQKSHDALDDALTLMEVYKKYKILNKDELEEFKKRKALFKKYKKEKNTIQKLCTVIFPILDNKDDLDLLVKEATRRYKTKDMSFDSFDEWREKE